MSKVLAALQAAYNAESTAAEKFHKQEHEFESGQRKVKKLAKWFDKRQREEDDRRHDLRNHMMRLGGTVDTDLGDTSYSSDPGKALEGTCAHLDGLTEHYEALHQAADEAGDRETCERFHGVSADIQKTYKKGEQKQQQLKDLGPELFIHKHS